MIDTLNVQQTQQNLAGINFKHEQRRVRRIIGRKLWIVCMRACMRVQACVCVWVCVYVCVCRSKDVRELSSIICLVKGIFSLILKYLAFQFSYLCKYCFWRRGKISLLSIHPCFSILGLGRLPPFPYQNLGVLEEYIRA